MIPGLGRSPGGGHDSLFQCSCLGNPKDRGAWRAAVHGVTKSRTRLKHLSMRMRTHTHAHMHSATYVFCCSDGSSLDRWGLLHLAPVSTWILLFLLLPPARSSSFVVVSHRLLASGHQEAFQTLSVSCPSHRLLRPSSSPGGGGLRDRGLDAEGAHRPGEPLLVPSQKREHGDTCVHQFLNRYRSGNVLCGPV